MQHVFKMPSHLKSQPQNMQSNGCHLNSRHFRSILGSKWLKCSTRGFHTAVADARFKICNLSLSLTKLPHTSYIFLLCMYLVLKECRKAPTIVCDTEVLRFWSYLFHNVIIELWHLLQEAAQLHVVEYLFFILCHQFLAHNQGTLPHLWTRRSRKTFNICVPLNQDL